jgi:hypothetical protein
LCLKVNKELLLVLINAKKERNTAVLESNRELLQLQQPGKSFSEEVTFELRTEWRTDHTLYLRLPVASNFRDEKNHMGKRNWGRPSAGSGVWLGIVLGTELWPPPLSHRPHLGQSERHTST